MIHCLFRGVVCFINDLVELTHDLWRFSLQPSVMSAGNQADAGTRQLEVDGWVGRLVPSRRVRPQHPHDTPPLPRSPPGPLAALRDEAPYPTQRQVGRLVLQPPREAATSARYAAAASKPPGPLAALRDEAPYPTQRQVGRLVPSRRVAPTDLRTTPLTLRPFRPEIHHRKNWPRTRQDQAAGSFFNRPDASAG